MCPPSSPEPVPDAVRLVGITRRFGRVVANRGVDLRVRAGTIHALVGENGAGKSTLMGVLAGVLRPDEGEVWIQGTRLPRADPAEAIRLGLGMVHQHFMLVEPLTVAENLVLGHEPTRRGLLDLDAAAAAVERLGAEHGLPLDPRRPVEALSVGERQRVEILKVLHRGAGVLVLDEPTAVLTPAEVEGLFAMLRRFRDQGRTVILITHKLDEVIALAERITVIRRGEVVAEVDPAGTSSRDLAHLMVGRAVALPGERSRDGARPVARDGPPALELEGLRAAGAGRPALDGVTLRVWPGEVLGVAGVQGNGQTELLECIAGLRPAAGGAVRLGGVDHTRATVRQRAAAGLAHVPEDRHRRGLVLALSVRENAILGRHREFRGPLGLAPARIAAFARDLIERHDVRPGDPEAAARGLSGGNQQKLVVARELTRRPTVLLAGQPTRGVDVGAIEAIHDHVRRARDGGAAVLLVSSELSELLDLADRIAVMRDGRVVAEVDAAATTAAELGERMTGAGA